MTPLNRDTNGGAINIGHNFLRLMQGESPIRAINDGGGGGLHPSIAHECASIVVNDGTRVGEYARTL